VYTRSGTTWSPTQRLAGTAQDRSDLFGAAAVLAGDTLIIGAPWESTGAAHSGAVYVYKRNGAMFSEVQKLKSSKPATNARFGWSLALNGERLVVGSPDDPPPHMRTGSAEIFVLRNGSWALSQFLQPPTLGAAANFGFRVAIRGEHVAISAPYPSAFPGSPTPTKPGEVYMFGPDGEGWKQTGMLRASHPRDTDWFGLALLMTDAGVLVGAPGDASGARGLDADASRSDAPFSGAVYMFAPTGQAWSESAFIKGDNTDINDWFGYELVSDGKSLVVSAMFENGSARMAGGGLTTGALYVFQ
jgi:trimeric autotransporter adhesin